jgi:hypothetical protein
MIGKKYKIAVFILAGFFLLTLFSCKTKYLEIQSKFEKAKLKKRELEVENKSLKKEIALLSDSLSVLVDTYNELKPYNEQINEIEGLKKDFLDNRVPYYLELKKRQTEKPKNKKP